MLSRNFNQLLFIVILIFKLQKNELWVLESIVGIGMYALKMADTGNYLRITSGKR